MLPLLNYKVLNTNSRNGIKTFGDVINTPSNYQIKRVTRQQGIVQIFEQFGVLYQKLLAFYFYLHKTKK